MLLAICATVAIYLYAGWTVCGFVFDYADEFEPEFLWNFHKEIRAPWGVKITKVILMAAVILLWMPFSASFNRQDFVKKQIKQIK